MKKLLVVLGILFVCGMMFAAANTSKTGIATVEKMLCKFQSDVKSLLITSTMVCVIAALPLLAIGAGLFFFKKDKPIWKTVGLAIAVLAIVAPVLLATIYILLPFILGLINGEDFTTMCG